MGEAYATTNVGAIVIYPNEDLQPEEGWSGEVGIKQLLAKGSTWRGFADVSAFWMEYFNMMEFSFSQWGNLTDPSFGAGFKSINVGPTRITGFEASLIGQGTLGKVGVTTTTGYTYANPISLDPEGVYARSNGGDISYTSSSSDTAGSILKYRYKHLIRSDVQVDYKGFTAGVSVRYNSFMQNIDGVFESALFEVFIPNNGIKSSREQRTAGDLIFDLRGGYRFSNGLELLFLVDNLLNTAYQPRPALWGPPRKFTLRMAYAF